jgi:hypothetical protein
MHMEDLSPARRRLLRLFQSINFGRVEELEVRDGEPAFSPAPRVFVELKLDVDDRPRPESRLERFALREPVERFFTQIARLNEGTVEVIEVRHGLPFRMVIEATPAEVEP